jgi:hypothetical protein
MVFFKTGRREGVLKKVVLEPPPFCRGCAAFLHNVVIVHDVVTTDAGSFFMNYNATLCKEAWEKKLPAQVT